MKMNRGMRVSVPIVVIVLALSCDPQGVLPPPVPPDPPSGYYTVTPTGLSVGARTVVGFNNNDDLAGTDGVSAFRFSSGVLQVLGSLPDADETGAVALNDAGEVAGFWRKSGVNPTVLRWPAGSSDPTTIPFATLSGRPVDINDAGDILLDVGAYSIAAGRDTAFIIWSQSGRETISSSRVSMQPGAHLWATALNQEREILAYTQDAFTEYSYLISSVSRAPSSGLCKGSPGSMREAPIALNDSGAYLVSNRGQLCIVRPGRETVALPGAARAFALNNNGWVVGRITNSDGSVTPMLWAKDSVIAAPRLFQSALDSDGWLIEDFLHINDRNEILAAASKSGSREFVILKPR